VVATDHAPHTRAEKDASVWDAPSGVPGVETALPLLLAEVRAGNLTLERVRDLTARNPAALFGLSQKGSVTEGADADFVVVDLEDCEQIDSERLHTSCGWTPFEGLEAVFPDLTVRRGEVVYRRETETFGRQEGHNVRAGDTV
jgi:dihydroorotase